jgi:hypothetical protein
MEIKNKLNIGIYCSSASYGGLEINLIRFAKWMCNYNINIHFFLVENTPIYENAKKEGFKITLIKKNKRYFDFVNAFKLSVKLKKADLDTLNNWAYPRYEPCSNN